MKNLRHRNLRRLLGTAGAVWVCHLFSGSAVRLFRFSSYLAPNLDGEITLGLQDYCFYIICIMMAVCADWLAERPEDQEREVQMQLIFHGNRCAKEPNLSWLWQAASMRPMQ